MATQLTVQQAAVLLNVSEKSIRRYIKSGRLSAHLEKGEKGEEYRIDKSALENIRKPQRGRPAISQKSKIQSSKFKEKSTNDYQKSKKSAVHYPLTTDSDFTPVKDIIKETSNQIIENKVQQSPNLLDHRILYEGLLNKYEQALVIIGSLEAQLASAPKSYETEMAQLRERLAQQEELVLDLYQTVKMYKEEQKDSLSGSTDLPEGETMLG